ncbi:PspC domain-containing protein [Halosquirtibacter laminarini]|uniref:PspC domain-containing protein n=1 Tax=Halosquirtibacter laminarini TaxID=3374600 RepID=A0AC61NED6_9BACT|nr:PspC domain-containing protein [Prolixibacteraceae bacterium]
MNKLRRSKNKVIAGVCGGLAKYINPDIDPVAVRAATVVLSICIPIIPIIYLVLALVIPDEKDYRY